MSKTTTDIGDNSNNNQVFQGNTVNISVNSIIIFLTSIFIIAIIALLLFFFFSKHNKDSLDEVTQLGALPIQNIQQEEIATATPDEPDKDLTKNEIIELYAKAQAVYYDWIVDCKYSKYENIIDNHDCTWYEPVYHDTIKTVTDVIDYCCSYFLSDCYFIKELESLYKEINGQLYYLDGNKGDAGYYLTSFSIKKVDNKTLKLNFKFTDFYSGNNYSDSTTIVYNNGKWLFTEDFNPSINVEDPIVKDNNVTLQKINDEYIVMYDEPRIGRVINTNGNGLKFRTTPEKNDDNLICTIDENTYLKVLGYDKYNTECLYVTNDKEYGFICSKDGNNKYFEYKK